MFPTLNSTYSKPMRLIQYHCNDQKGICHAHREVDYIFSNTAFVLCVIDSAYRRHKMEERAADIFINKCVEEGYFSNSVDYTFRVGDLQFLDVFLNNDVSFDVMITDADKQPIVAAVKVQWFAPYPLISNLFGTSYPQLSIHTGQCFEK